MAVTVAPATVIAWLVMVIAWLAMVAVRLDDGLCFFL